MKKSNCIFALIAFFALAVSNLIAQSPVGKTFTKSFNLSGFDQVRLELPGTVEVKEWENTSLRFEISVSLPEGQNPALLNELANVGRYDLAAKETGRVLTIDAPNLMRLVKVKGVELKENLHFVVFAPKSLSIEVKESAPGIVVAKNK